MLIATGCLLEEGHWKITYVEDQLFWEDQGEVDVNCREYRPAFDLDPAFEFCINFSMMFLNIQTFQIISLPVTCSRNHLANNILEHKGLTEG